VLSNFVGSRTDEQMTGLNTVCNYWWVVISTFCPFCIYVMWLDDVVFIEMRVTKVKVLNSLIITVALCKLISN
jgi:hypothetical protein